MADPAGGFLSLEKLVAALVAALGAAFWWGWNHIHKRIDIVRADIHDLRETKADSNEFDRHRGHLERVFARLDEQGKQLARIETKLDMLPKRKDDI